jgi:hypothetical protein
MRAIERRIRFSAALIIAGLLVEAVSFAWASPLAFFLFLIVACTLVAAGLLLFLLSLVTTQRSEGGLP